MALARAAVSKNNKQTTLNDRASPNPTPPLPSFFHLLAPSLSPLLCFSSPLKPLLKPSIFKFPSFSSSTSLSMSRLSASAARAGAFKNEKQKTLDDGATTSRSPNPTPPTLPSFFHLMLRLETPPYKDTNPTAQPKEEEDPSLSIDDRIAALGKKPIDFKPHSAAFWKDGEPVPFLFLARALDLIAGESRRIVITEILCNVFRTVMATTPQDLTATVYLSANRIAPSHEGVELGIGDATLIKALGEAYGRNEKQIKNQLKGLGDLGLVAKGCCSLQSLLCRPSPLTVVKVLDTFRIIAKETGEDSQDKKRNHIKGLLVEAIDCEPLYLIRLLQSKMRISSAQQTVLVALGQASVYSENYSNTPPLDEAAKIIEQVYSVLPDYDKIVSALLRDGVWKLPAKCTFTLGIPVGPMLAKLTKGVTEILDKFQESEFTCEYKYDGERAQIHYMEDGSVQMYGRNTEPITGKYPDVVSSVSRFKKPSVRSFVLDCEVAAYDPGKQKILPFQQRGRFLAQAFIHMNCFNSHPPYPFR